MQADWLELLVLRQELSDIREKDSPTQERNRGWTRLRQEAEKLLQRIEAREELIHKMGEAREPPSGTRHSPEPRRPTQARREMPETYASVLLSLARCWELEGNPAKAVSILRPAAIPPRGEEINPRVKELRAETARILATPGGLRTIPVKPSFGKRCLAQLRFKRLTPTRNWHRSRN